MLRRNQQIYVARDPAARLAQKQPAETIVFGNPPALLPDRVTGRGRDPTYNNIAHLTLGMGADDVYEFRASHLVDILWPPPVRGLRRANGEQAARVESFPGSDREIRPIQAL